MSFIYSNPKHNSKRERDDRFTREFFRPVFRGMVAMTVFAFAMAILISRSPAFVKSLLTFHY